MEDFETEVVFDEDQEVEQEPGFFRKAWEWLKSNPGVLITTGLTIGVETYKLFVRSKEYEDYIYVTDSEDGIAKIPAKRMRSVKRQGRKTFRKTKR